MRHVQKTACREVDRSSRYLENGSKPGLNRCLRLLSCKHQHIYTRIYFGLVLQEKMGVHSLMPYIAALRSFPFHLLFFDWFAVAVGILRLECCDVPSLRRRSTSYCVCPKPKSLKTKRWLQNFVDFFFSREGACHGTSETRVR